MVYHVKVLDILMTKQTNILLVEDDASLSTVLADYLRSKDYTVETSVNGREAWELIIRS